MPTRRTDEQSTKAPRNTDGYPATFTITFSRVSGHDQPAVLTKSIHIDLRDSSKTWTETH